LIKLILGSISVGSRGGIGEAKIGFYEVVASGVDGGELLVDLYAAPHGPTLEPGDREVFLAVFRAAT
jgi:hypothetical protein